ncbi:unnamed protein product [Malus baccata var. baccata]
MEERNSTTFDAKQFVSNCSFLDFSNLNNQSAVSLKRFLSNYYDLHFVSLPTLSSALSLLSQMSTTNLSLMLEEKNHGQSKKESAPIQQHGGQEKGWPFPNKQDQRLNRKNHKHSRCAVPTF